LVPFFYFSSLYIPLAIVTPSLRFFRSNPVLPGFGLSFGFSVLYISLVILIPLSALLIYVSGMSWSEYWFAISDVRVLQSYKATLTGALYSTIAVTIIGFILAWIISRYDFPGRRLIDALVLPCRHCLSSQASLVNGLHRSVLKSPMPSRVWSLR
jgi:ABC-type glycerol-3-phosphate transport system permease component